MEKDPDLSLKVDEPETWSTTIDRKTLKKMEKKDIKRQENIFGESGDLIITAVASILLTLMIFSFVGFVDRIHPN